MASHGTPIYSKALYYNHQVQPPTPAAQPTQPKTETKVEPFCEAVGPCARAEISNSNRSNFFVFLRSQDPRHHFFHRLGTPDPMVAVPGRFGPPMVLEILVEGTESLFRKLQHTLPN